MSQNVAQLNGGGCLAPPPPNMKESEMLSETLKSIGGLGDPHLSKLSNYERYSREWPTSLAWRSSAQSTMVQGVGGRVDPNNLAVPPDFMSSCGAVMRNGRRVLLDRPRETGGLDTSTEEMHEWRVRPLSSKFLNHFP